MRASRVGAAVVALAGAIFPGDADGNSHGRDVCSCAQGERAAERGVGEAGEASQPQQSHLAVGTGGLVQDLDLRCSDVRSPGSSPD